MITDGSQRLLDRFRGALVGTAVGDALGAPVEGYRDVPLSYLESLDTEPPNLRYTDDTAMTIGVARSLVERGGFDGRHMAETLAEAHAREPWRGYGPGPPQVFSLLSSGVPWDQAGAELFGGEGSFGNGGAMRVAPIALHAYPDRHEAAEIAGLSATITHTHPEGIDGAVAQAVGVIVALDASEPVPPDEMVAALMERVETPVFRGKLRHLELHAGTDDLMDIAGVLGTGIAAHASVPTALACFLMNPESFPDAVKAAIRLGGDTDTIAAMAGALAGARHGYAAIPVRWRDVEGVDELVSLADALAAGHSSGR